MEFHIYGIPYFHNMESKGIRMPAASTVTGPQASKICCLQNQ